LALTPENDFGSQSPKPGKNFMRAIKPHNPPVLLRILRARVFVPLAILAVFLGGAPMLAAQAPAPAASAHKPLAQHKRASAAHAKRKAAKTISATKAASAAKEAKAAEAAPAAAKPAAPEMPKWPANEKPVEAAITWDSKGLRIVAANSSLQQILHDVTTATGVEVEGCDDDQRVFGTYGPGPARDVLGLLLQGTGYNVMMIGDQGQGTPREVVLSSRHGGSVHPTASSPDSDDDDDDDADEPPQAAAPPPMRTGPGRTPPEMQQRNMENQQRQRPEQQPNEPGNPD
jgi:hypothetical protein